MIADNTANLLHPSSVMNINITSNIKPLTKRLNSAEKKQIPFALSKALNNVAFATVDKANPTGLKQKADKIFDGGAVAFTKSGFRFKKSTKKNLEAIIFVESEREKYLKFQINGGTRFPNKKAIIVPTDNMKLNKYGNITKATREKLFNDRKKYFFGIPKGKSGKNNEGIWERYGRRKSGDTSGYKMRMVAQLTSKAQYRPKFPFAETVEGVVFSQKRGIGKEFEKALKDAIRTMR